MEMQTKELRKAAEFGTPLYVFHEEELKETKVDSEYHKSQYKKYYELSKELENQLGVYLN